MAMLMAQEDTDTPATFSTLSVNAPAFTPPKPVATEQPRQLPQPQSQAQCWAAAWEGCGTAGWPSEASAQPAAPALTGSARHAAAIQQAAQEGFGAMLKEVVVANDGYMILLHASFRQYEEEVPALTILSRALWP